MIQNKDKKLKIGSVGMSRNATGMTREKKYQLIELLEELRDEEIQELTKEYNMTEKEIRKMLEREPEDVYEMDDGDCLLQGIDTVLGALS